MRNACPPIVTSKSRIKPVGLTKLVSATRSQNGQGSHSWIFRVLQVWMLITLTPDPPSTIVPSSSCPLTMAVIARLLVATTTGPSSGFEKKAEAGNGFDEVNSNFSPSVN